jgi:hypothetical protein
LNPVDPKIWIWVGGIKKPDRPKATANPVFSTASSGNTAVPKTFPVLGPVAFRPTITRGLALAQITQLADRNI